MNGNSSDYWTTARRVRWWLITTLCVVLFGPGLFDHLKPDRTMILDFYQEWSSARSLFTDLPVYASLEETVPRYLGLRREPGTDWYWSVNVHPPTSVLLAVPLQWIDYWNAFFIWNIVSLLALALSVWIIVRQLRIDFPPPAILPLVTIALLSDPLRQQVIQGQLNLVLLLVLTGIWAADRNDRPVLAGTLLALATAIKLFPGFLIIYFALRRNWQACRACAVAFIAITGITVWATGVDAFETYIFEILPSTSHWRSAWNNASIAGFWFKLFHPVQQGRVLTPLLENATVAYAGFLCSVLALLAILFAVVRTHGVFVGDQFQTSSPKTQLGAEKTISHWLRNRVRDERSDAAFGLCVTAMLLVSPVTWEHYFLLLTLPLGIHWASLRDCRSARLAFSAICVVLCLPIILICNILIPGGFFGGQADALHTVTLLSLQCYALLGLFAMQVRAIKQASPEPDFLATAA